MNIMIAYATTEGQTRKVAETAGKQLAEAGHEVVLHDVQGLQKNVSVGDFDRIIVAGSVHNRRHQEPLELFAFAHRNELAAKPTLLISVSMAAAFDDSRNDAEGYVERFCSDAKWQPSRHVMVAGAMKHGEYGWYEENLLRAGDLAKHADEEMHEDREFTDWDQLRQSVAEFMEMAS